MKRGDFRRERLAQMGLERFQRPPETGWQAFKRHGLDAWHRFMAGSGLEKGFFVGASLLAVVLAIGGLVALVRGGVTGESSPAVSAEDRTRATATGSVDEIPTPTAIVISVNPLPTRRPTPTDEPAPASDGENRADCDAIRGTSYLSDTERDWYIRNCDGASVTNPPTQPPPGGGGPPPPPTATSPPAPSEGVSSGEAISLAVTWMTTSAPKSYTVDAGTCTAVSISGHWVVTCEARLAGCQSAACETVLDVCVFDDRRVVSGSSC